MRTFSDKKYIKIILCSENEPPAIQFDEQTQAEQRYCLYLHMASRCWLAIWHNDSQTQGYTQKSPYSAWSKTTEPHLLKLKRPLGDGTCRKARLWSFVGICLPLFALLQREL